MNTLAQSAVGRMLLHLMAMVGDRELGFHLSGILRELRNIAPRITPTGRTPDG